MASKVIDEFMKLVGKSYLQQTLQFCIDEVNKWGEGGGGKIVVSCPAGTRLPVRKVW